MNAELRRLALELMPRLERDPLLWVTAPTAHIGCTAISRALTAEFEGLGDHDVALLGAEAIATTSPDDLSGFVVLDGPPLLSGCPDLDEAWRARLGQAIVVVGERFSALDDLDAAQRWLEALDVELLGFVYNPFVGRGWAQRLRHVVRRRLGS